MPPITSFEGIWGSEEPVALPRGGVPPPACGRLVGEELCGKRTVASVRLASSQGCSIERESAAP
jgi:hypothetical protein